MTVSIAKHLAGARGATGVSIAEHLAWAHGATELDDPLPFASAYPARGPAGVKPGLPHTTNSPSQGQILAHPEFCPKIRGGEICPDWESY